MKKCNKCSLEKDESFFHKGASKCKICVKEYYKLNKDKIKIKKEEWRKNNSESIKIKEKEYRQKNFNRRNQITKEWRNNKIEYVKSYKKEYREKNKENIKNYQNNYNKTRKKQDNLYLLTTSIRSLISNSMRKMGYSKKSKINKILNCSFLEFKEYIESKFEDGMSWNNYGE